MFVNCVEAQCGWFRFRVRERHCDLVYKAAFFLVDEGALFLPLYEEYFISVANLNMK